MKARSLLLAIVLCSLAAVLGFTSLEITPLPGRWLFAARWTAIASLVLHGLYRRTLTTWILICMFAGAAIGHDWPGMGINLRIVSVIFLRLIKTIIAPLLFATLVSGIAAHSDLRKIGRMGLKAIVYFEFVTTLALIIGLAAINISKAGIGAPVSTQPVETLPAEKLTATETILHVFPENIARSVVEGQVLQVVVFSILFGIGLAMVSEERRGFMLRFTESLAEKMSKITNTVMYFEPLG